MYVACIYWWMRDMTKKLEMQSEKKIYSWLKVKQFICGHYSGKGWKDSELGQWGFENKRMIQKTFEGRKVRPWLSNWLAIE